MSVNVYKIGPGVVIMGGDSCPDGRGFECTLSRHFSHVFVVKIVMFV